MNEKANLRHLILGGARSGKSGYAEQVAHSLFNESALPSQLIYLATATAGDHEMSQRIAHHQQRRNSDWRLVEETQDIASVINSVKPNATVLIDCLTLWLSNCLHHESWETERAKFLESLTRTQANVVMVSNEVGSGIIPMGELSRQFVDQSGWLHQQIAQIVEQVSLVVAGLPTSLKNIAP